MNARRSPASRVPPHVPPERVIDFDIASDAALRRDVFKRLAEIRMVAPKVCYTPRNGGHWLAFGREELQRILSDGETFSSSHIGAVLTSGPGMIPLSLDPPAHTPYRQLLFRHLGPRRIAALEPLVRSWAERLIGGVADRTSCDFLRDVAEPLPVSVFMELMGLPLERFKEFRSLVRVALTPPRPGEDAAARMDVHSRIVSMLTELIGTRKHLPRDDLVSKLLAEEISGRSLTDAEMLSICYLLVMAGLDTVTNAMTYGMRHLAMDMQMQSELRGNRGLIPAAVEKLLRLYSFVNTHRVVRRDTQLDGATLRAGEMVWCILWGGSNEPGGETEGPRHMAFGSGNHLCLGMYLARLELRVMYETWFEQIGPFCLAADDRPAMHGGTVMNIERLLLLLEPRQGSG